MKTIYDLRFTIYALLLLLAPLGARAQGLAAAANYTTTVSPTNAWIPFPAGVSQSRIFSISAYNTNASTAVYLQIFDTNGIPANGTAAAFATVKVTADSTGGYDFGLAGCPFTNGLAISSSSFGPSLTTNGAGFVITIIYNKR